MQSYDWNDIVDSCRLYQSQLSSEDEVRHEYEQWKSICLRMAPANRPTTPLQEIDITNVIRRLMAMPAKVEAMRQADTDDTAANTIGSNTGIEAPPIGVGRYLNKVSKVSKLRGFI